MENARFLARIVVIAVLLSLKLAAILWATFNRIGVVFREHFDSLYIAPMVLLTSEPNILALQIFKKSAKL